MNFMRKRLNLNENDKVTLLTTPRGNHVWCGTHLHYEVSNLECIVVFNEFEKGYNKGVSSSGAASSSGTTPNTFCRT